MEKWERTHKRHLPHMDTPELADMEKSSVQTLDVIKRSYQERCFIGTDDD